MFCGTVATVNGITEAEVLEIELSDPIVGRAIRHRYRAEPLLVVK